jgi:anaerobic selenocysteine-containing dehydrogenase
MTQKVSRRDFLKIGGVATAAAVLTGCGPTARYVTRRPYADMPEYNQTGVSTYFASTCRECPAGCGIIVRTMEGRAIKIEGNPDHPVNKGKICSRGLTAIQGLYNPDRVRNPRKNAARSSELYDLMKWDNALPILQKALEDTPPDQIAFISGTSPDHISLFIKEWTMAMGIPAPIQYSPYEYFSNNDALILATSNLYQKLAYPFFDIGNATLVVSFGADFLQSWLSPVAYSRYYSQLRTKQNGSRGKLIVFESRQSLTGGNADEWYPIRPGSFAFAAQAVGAIVSKLKGENNPLFSQVDLKECAKQCGLDESIFQKVGTEIVASERCVILPGTEGIVFDQVVAGTEMVLEMNRIIGSTGQTGGLFLSRAMPAPSTNTISTLAENMKAGSVQLLLVHGVNPVFDLPASLGFSTALKNVKQVISFSTFPDETSAQSDYVFPDHSPMESWGFHQSLAGSDREVFSSFQPVVSPFYDTKSTIDVLLASVKASKKLEAKSLPYSDEVDFIQNKIQPLIDKNGSIEASNMPVFWSVWLQNGGWWEKERNLEIPATGTLPHPVLPLSPIPVIQDKKLMLQVFQTQLGDGYGANRPWLQETPNPQTTAMWNTWVELNPQTAARLGVKSDDIVKIKSQFGEIEAIVYEYPALHPDCAAIPFGQGHTALGRYAANRGSNPATLLPFDSPPNHSFQAVLIEVDLLQTGKKKTLARYESKEGVYGHD